MTSTLEQIKNTKQEDVTPGWIDGLEFDWFKGRRGKAGYDEDQIDAVLDVVGDRIANLMRDVDHWKAKAAGFGIAQQPADEQLTHGIVGDGPIPLGRDEIGLLTFTEHRAVECLADLWGLLGRIIGKGRNQRDDLAELIVPVHALQNAILAQAAARAYPDRYRLMGESISDEVPADA